MPIVSVGSTPTGTFTRKIHGHENASVSTPPKRTPAAAPKPPTAPQTPSAMFRSRPSVNVVDRIERAAGVMIAAPSPWSARAPISDASLHAKPETSEPSVKTMLDPSGHTGRVAAASTLNA